MSKRLIPEDLDRLLELIAQNNGVLAVSALDAVVPGSAAHRLADANELYWINEITRVSDGRLSNAEIDRAAQFLSTVEIQQAVFGPMAQAVEDLALGDNTFGLRLVWVRADSLAPGMAGISSDQIVMGSTEDAGSQGLGAGMAAALPPSAPPVSLSSFAAALDPAAQPLQHVGERDDTASSSATGGRAGFNAALACLFLQTGTPVAQPYDGWEDFQARNGLSVDLVTDLKTAYPEGFAKLNFCVGLAAVASKRPSVADAVQTSLAEQMEIARAIHNFDGLALLQDVHGLEIDIRVELPDLIARHGGTLDGLVAALPSTPPTALVPPADASGKPVLSGLPQDLAATQIVVAAASAAVTNDAMTADPAADATLIIPASTDLSAAVIQLTDAAPDSTEVLISSPDAGTADAPADVPATAAAISLPVQAAAGAVDFTVKVGAKDASETDHDDVVHASRRDDASTDDSARAFEDCGPSSGFGDAGYDDPVVLPTAGHSPPQPAIALRVSLGTVDSAPLDTEAASMVRVVDHDGAEEGGAEFLGADRVIDDNDCDDDIGLGETGADFVMFALGSDTLVLQPQYLEPPDGAGEPEFWPDEQGPAIPDQIMAYGFNDDTFGASLWDALEAGHGAVILDSDNLRLVSFDGNDSGRGDLLCL